MYNSGTDISYITHYLKKQDELKYKGHTKYVLVIIMLKELPFLTFYTTNLIVIFYLHFCSDPMYKCSTQLRRDQL